MIEKYVVSLDLAKELKEAGWEKYTIYVWAINVGEQHKTLVVPHAEVRHEKHEVWFGAFAKHYQEILPAPLAEEIIEGLPKKITDEQTYRLRIERHDDHYTVGYCYDYLFSYRQDKNIIAESVLRWLKLITDSNISNALARLWLWLKENGYLEGKNED